MAKEISLLEIEKYIKALHCDIRWAIIEFLRDGPRSSDEIFKEMEKEDGVLIRILKKKHSNHCTGQCNHNITKNLKKPSLYYHLRELEEVGIIELANYKPSPEKRAPEKVWKLNVEKLTINFMK